MDSIILRMLTNFQNRVCTPENRAAMEKAGYSLEELVTLASIIQKESANVEEMYNVSSVFTNRLEEGSEYPKLESCTTNNFINDYITPYFGGAPSQEVLTAYDTYDRSGFPVGAIASAGADAIDAALHPEKNTLDGTYYFFVTDVEYTHYYGRTYQEHLQNIEKAKAVNRTHGIEGRLPLLPEGRQKGRAHQRDVRGGGPGLHLPYLRDALLLQCGHPPEGGAGGGAGAQRPAPFGTPPDGKEPRPHGGGGGDSLRRSEAPWSKGKAPAPPKTGERGAAPYRAGKAVPGDGD